MPELSNQHDSLHNLLLRLDLAWKKSEALVDLECLNALKEESVALERCFAYWQSSRVSEFKPTIVGHVSAINHDSEIEAGYWPGKVEMYVDLYVAGVWNVFRVGRLLLVALIIDLSDKMGNSDSCISYINTANYIVADIIASVPYHLADNLQAFMSELGTGTGILEPGKSLGGLLLMHPLYLTSNMLFLPEPTREYMRRCLTWIGSNMGFGQATILAKVRSKRCFCFKLST